MPADAHTREDALAIVRALRDAGHVAYFAGGCVRDALLGLTPKDYDIATDAPPQRVRELFGNTQSVGAAFGVILVRHRKSVIEVATFRTDISYVDGRRPQAVRFTTAQEDAQRRDFTINGLFFDPIENKVIDYVGGQSDLQTKTLRAVGEPNHRFEEDHLRLLRAVRFAARFGLIIEPNTADAIRAHAEHLKRISPERIAEELRLMLTPPTRVLAWRMLWTFGLMPVLFRHLREKPSSPVPVERGSEPLFPNLAPDQSVPFGLALAAMALCYRIGGHYNEPTVPLLERGQVLQTVKACRFALKISNDEAELIDGATELAPLVRGDPPPLALMKRALAKPHAAAARAMLAALARSDYTLRPRARWLLEQFARLQNTDYAPAPLLTGDDLTAAGLTPGPLFKRLLDQVYDAQLEDRVQTKDAAMAMAQDLARQP